MMFSYLMLSIIKRSTAIVIYCHRTSKELDYSENDGEKIVTVMVTTKKIKINDKKSLQFIK